MLTLNASTDETRNLATPCPVESPAMQAARAIGFIHSGAFSHANDSLREVLSREFPDALLRLGRHQPPPGLRRHRRPMMALNVVRDYG